MINREELMVCKRRGHDTEIGLKSGWVKCKWCGMWLREVVMVQEREDDPPASERNAILGLRQKLSDLDGEPEKPDSI